MSGALSGKTVVVLGGSGAHGAAAVRAPGREGANVALGELAREFSGEGIHAAEVTVDARHLEDLEGCAEAVTRALKDPPSGSAELRVYRA